MPLPLAPLPVCLLLTGRRPLLDHPGVETVQLVGGHLRMVGCHCRPHHDGGRWGGRAADKCLLRGWLAEVVDAGVVGVAVVVLHIRDGGRLRGDVGGVGSDVTGRETVRQEKGGTNIMLGRHSYFWD